MLLEAAPAAGGALVFRLQQINFNLVPFFFENFFCIDVCTLRFRNNCWEKTEDLE